MAQAIDLQRGQIGIETVAGTAVSANRVLQDVAWELDPNEPFTDINPVGFLAPTDVTSGKRTADVTFTSEATNFNTLAYIFNNYWKTGVITTPTGGTLTRRHTFFPSAVASPAAKTFTLEIGPSGSTDARRAVFVKCDSFDLVFDENKGVAITGGKGFGRTMADGVTITAAPTGVVQDTMQGLNIAHFLSTDPADLVYDNASLADFAVKPMAAKLTHPSRWAAVNKQDSSNDSFDTVVVKKHVPVGSVTFDADDATLAGVMTKQRARTQVYWMVRVTGDEIETGFPRALYITFPCKLRNNKRANTQSVYSHTFDLMLNYVDTFNTTGGYYLAEIDTPLTAL